MRSTQTREGQATVRRIVTVPRFPGISRELARDQQRRGGGRERTGSLVDIDAGLVVLLDGPRDDDGDAARKRKHDVRVRVNDEPAEPLPCARSFGRRDGREIGRASCRERVS